MKLIAKLAIIFSPLLCLSGVCHAAAPKRGLASCSIRYQNHNQVDYGPLTVSTIGGRVIDSSQTAVPKACVGLFTENGHKLVASKKTDGKGTFSFEGVPDGKYRLVVSAGPLCAASVPVLMAAETTSKQPIIVHMRPPGLDSCSYGELEENTPR